MSKRKQHAPEFKAKVALKARGDRVGTGKPVRRASNNDQPMELGGSENDPVNRFPDQRAAGWRVRCF